MKTRTVVTVRYVSGREERFEMEFWVGEGTQERLLDFAEKPNLLLRTGEELIIIPASAIECITIKKPKGDARFEFSEARPARRIE